MALKTRAFFGMPLTFTAQRLELMAQVMAHDFFRKNRSVRFLAVMCGQMSCAKVESIARRSRRLGFSTSLSLNKLGTRDEACTAEPFATPCHGTCLPQ